MNEWMNEWMKNLTIKTPERRQWDRSRVFIVTAEEISRIALVFLLLILKK